MTGGVWHALPDILAAAGAEVVEAPAAASTIRFVAARSLALSACGSFTGAGEGRTGVLVTVSGSCDLLGENTVIRRVGGVDPIAAPAEFHEFLRKACAQGATVSLELLTEGIPDRRELRCTAPVETAPPDIRVRRAHPPALPKDRS